MWKEINVLKTCNVILVTIKTKYLVLEIKNALYKKKYMKIGLYSKTNY